MKTPEKIMIITTTDNMIWQFLLPHISQLQSDGHTVECVCAKTGFWFDELTDKYNLKVHEINFARSPFKLQNMSAYKRLVSLQKKESFSVIYCQQPVGGAMGRLIARKFKLPCIYTAHGHFFFKGNSKLKNFVFKNVEKYLAKFTTALVTINQEDYQASKNWKSQYVFKINGIGVDLTKYIPLNNNDKAALKDQLGLKDDDFVITSIGELNKNKNTFRLLEVIKSIDNPNIKYIICGQGPLQKKYEDYIKANNLQNRVLLLGFRKDIANILSISNVYIMPSYREGLPRSMMEAMALELPIIASSIRGNMDLVGDNEGGILCSAFSNDDYKNAILTLYNNPKLEHQFGERNKTFVQNFSLPVVIEQLNQIYKHL